ncbi:MAG: hypothetical protein QMD76_00040 [Anaerosomatales bacterium]|nr:hypothetical protein [Anaerosomatales bacterium]
MTPGIMEFRLGELAATLAGYAETGVPLIAKTAGALRAAGFSDDPGLYFFVPLIARLLGTDAQTAYSIFVIGSILLAAAVGLAGFFALTRDARARAYAVLALAVLSAGAYRVADVYTVGFAYPTALVPWMLWLWRREQRLKVAGPLLATVAGALGACAHLVRSHAATSMLLFIGVLVVLTPRRDLKTRVAWLLAFVLGANAVLGGFTLLLDHRDAYLEAHVPGYEKTPVGHPFWHSAYIGLAYLPNPYVSAWDDTVAARKAAELDSEAPYLSERYEAVLRSEYLRIVRSDPLFAVRTYGAKLLVALARALACIGLGLIALMRRRPPTPLLAAFGGAIAFETLPSLMTMPFHPYMLGLYSWSGLFGAACVAYAVDPQSFAGLERNTQSVASM